MSNDEAEKAVNTMLSEITAALQKGDRVIFSEVGILKPVPRKARQGRNPSTGGPLSLPAHMSVKFTLSKSLKQTLNP